MNETNTYNVTVNGIVYLVVVECLDRPAAQQVSHDPWEPGNAVQQAPWVTAHRIAHLPPR